MKICLIGSGNVATHLGGALIRKGHEIIQIFSRQLDNAVALSAFFAKQQQAAERSAELPGEQVGRRSAESPTGQPAEAIDQLKNIDLSADLYFICVSDSAISAVIEQLPNTIKGIVVHTSGSTHINVFDPYLARHSSLKYGVFYPLQTFTKEKEIDFSVIPIALEAPEAAVYTVLEKLAKQISNEVFACSSEQREALHIAAVFACNFSNYFFHEAEKLLEKNGLSFNLVRPLILEMAQKAQVISPRFGQTGPAVRKDWNIVNKHLDFLDRDPTTDPRIRSLYEQLSYLIAEMKDNKTK